jgi:hypothetical protein
MALDGLRGLWFERLLVVFEGCSARGLELLIWERVLVLCVAVGILLVLQIFER